MELPKPRRMHQIFTGPISSYIIRKLSLCLVLSLAMSDLPYAADAEQSLSYDELKVRIALNPSIFYY